VLPITGSHWAHELAENDVYAYREDLAQPQQTLLGAYSYVGFTKRLNEHQWLPGLMPRTIRQTIQHIDGFPIDRQRALPRP
jgi:hypothetical protein